jgi:hypothetical protein
LLLSGHPDLPVSTLATLAQVSATLASHHLSTLQLEGWVAITQHGPHRRVQFANPQRAAAAGQMRQMARLARGLSSLEAE